MEGLEHEIVISFDECVNDAYVSQYSGGNHIGGFIGYIQEDKNVTLTISNSVNNGIVTGDCSIGGFVGSIEHVTNMNLVISDSVNNGHITGSQYDGVF